MFSSRACYATIRCAGVLQEATRKGTAKSFDHCLLIHEIWSQVFLVHAKFAVFRFHRDFYSQAVLNRMGIWIERVRSPYCERLIALIAFDNCPSALRIFQKPLRFASKLAKIAMRHARYRSSSQKLRFPFQKNLHETCVRLSPLPSSLHMTHRVAKYYAP